MSGYAKMRIPFQLISMDVMDGVFAKGASFLAASMTMMGSVSIISRETAIPFGLVVGGMLIVAGIAWQLSARMSEARADISSLRNRLARLESIMDRDHDRRDHDG